MKSKSDITKLLMLLIAAICSILTAEARNFHLAQNGKLLPFTTFDQAMEKANPNDTIYLDRGYPGELTVTKPSTIIGSPSTIVDLSINLNEEYQEMGNVSLEGVRCEYIKVQSNIGRLILKNIDAGRYSSYEPVLSCASRAKINHLIVDRCYLYNFVLRSDPNESKSLYADTVNMRNSIISGYINGNAINKNTTHLKNCYINDAYPFHVTLTNCLYGTFADKNTGENYYSYFANGVSLKDTKALIEAGYVGDDGTAAGPYGGEEPTYSLTPDYPTTEEGSIEFDKVNKKLKIKVKAYEE